MPKKVLLDTDIGSDIDDAVCLAYLLAHPDCELMGVTTVTGEADRRAQMASALCRAAGREVPIFPGSETPLLIEQRQKTAPQAAALDRWDHASVFPKGHAVAFLRETIRRHPGEITLLAIGPMTNVGLLFANDPEIPRLLAGLVIMCGVFRDFSAGRGPLEWNAIGDPHATAIVYRHPVAVHRSIGLDVTCRVRMGPEEVRRRFKAPRLAPVLDFAKVWFERVNTLTFHDPLAAATIFDDGVCGFERGRVDVELTGPRVLGMTHWTPDAKGPHHVALSVDPDRYLAHFFSIVGG